MPMFLEDDSLQFLDRHLNDQLRAGVVGDWELKYLMFRSLRDISETLEAHGEALLGLTNIIKGNEQTPVAGPIKVSQNVFEGKLPVNASAQKKPLKRRGSHPRSLSIPNARKPWTDKDVADLRSLLNWGMSDQEIGEMFGRTKDSIRTRREKLGIPCNPGNPGSKQTTINTTTESDAK